MRHFEEILITLGGVNPELKESSPLWDYWIVEFPTPASTVTAAYLYLKTKCPLKEATSAARSHWAALSPTGTYEVVLPPKSPLSKEIKQTGSTFSATDIRTSTRLLFENLLAALAFKKIEEEEYFVDPDIVVDGKEMEKSASQVLYRWLTAVGLHL